MNGMAIRESGEAAGQGWLLALHSCSESLGVGLLPWPATPRSAAEAQAAADPVTALRAAGDPCLAQARIEVFPTGRDLSNRLLDCLEAVLPAAQWPQLVRLAVAIGPGGFTSTRLTVVLLRTLAMQDDLPLDGVSSFQLIARRLSQADPPVAPFWLAQDLPRRGRVAGLYGLDPAVAGGVAELEAPRLRDSALPLDGLVFPAEPSLPADVGQLLAISVDRARRGAAAAWQSVLPIYPTSPVQQL